MIRPPAPMKASSERDDRALAQLGAGPPAALQRVERAPVVAPADRRHGSPSSCRTPVALVGLDQVAVRAAACVSSSSWLALGRDPAVDQEHDLVGQRDGGRPAGHDQRGDAVELRWRPVRMRASVVGSRLEVASSSSSSCGPAHQRPGQGDALALPARQRDAPLPDDGVDAVGQLLDERPRTATARARRGAAARARRGRAARSPGSTRRTGTAPGRPWPATRRPTATEPRLGAMSPSITSQQRGLARAGRADHGHRAARWPRSGRRR